MTIKSRITGVIFGAVALIFTSAIQAQNGIEPRYERYNADRKSIEVDGDLSDWAGVSFIEPRFEASDGRETGKGNSTIGDVTYSTFAEYGGGTWSGPDDHTTLIAVAWDQNGLYLGIIVKDDEHEHAANNAWNGDGVQMGLTDPDRSTVTHLYNYCIKDGYESGKVYKSGDAGIIADKERGPGNYSVAMVRDDDKKTTTYEALFTPDSFGFAKFEVGQQFGFGVCVNDGDKGTPGQKGWSGWGPHMIVFGKTAPDAALVTLTAAEVLASFETDFSDGEIPETAELFGVAEIGPDERDESDEPNEFLHVTDALNGQNGSMKIQDITDGRTFKEFEVGFRLYISDSTCCGSDDDWSPAHRPADGWSLSIGNDLPDTISLPEEGTGSGIRICFDTWDSGGGEAPAIDVWNGVEGEVGDGAQDTWSGGLFVRQKFDGVTAAKDEEKFRDPDTDEFVFMWTHGEWVDFSLKVYSGRIIINYKGYEMINEELPAGWPALTAPQWLFAGRTGGANSAHWVDDFYVKVFKPSGPIISAFEGGTGGFSVSLVDAEGNGLDVDSAKAKFDGVDVAVNKTKSDGETTITYSTDGPLPSGSDHTIELTYSDEKGTVHVKTLSFTVPNYVVVSADSVVPDSTKGESGFIANITQISTEQTGKGSLHNNKVANAEKQLNGEFIDPDFEEPWMNEADFDAEEGWSYYPVWVEWVNQNQDAPNPVGNFSANNGYEDEYIPGIPGWYDSTDGIAGEYLALLQLDEGAYTLGVNSDDGFRATIGVNYNDVLAQEIGIFDGGRGASDSIFDIFITKAGLYPFRVLWFEGGGGANIEIFSVVDGEKILINDPDVDGAIKAFIPKGATVDEQIMERDATTGRAAVVSITPASGQKRVEPDSLVEVVIENGSATTVNQSSVKMSLNGQDVDVDVSKSGDVVTITHTPDGGLAGEVNTAIVSFKESNGTERSAEWNFEVKVTKPAPVLASFLIDFGGTAANSAGASPDPWITFDNLVMDETADLGDGVTITALDDNFTPNNPAQPGEDAEYDGVVVPQEARNDYFFKNTDTAGTTARMRIDGLPAGVYNVTVFEGRTTDGGQYAKIWTGEEPEEENTGNFAQGSATVEVNVSAGEPLWYKHLEDNTGGVSGMIIRKTSEPGITWDFNDGLPEGSEVAGNAEHSEDEGVDDSGALVLTRALNSQRGGWLSPEIGTVPAFTIDFDIYIADGTTTQADGISMAISDDLEPVEAFGEEGKGTKLIVSFDNWDNGGGEAPAIDIFWEGVLIAREAMGAQGASTLDTDGWWPVHIELTSGGDLTLLYNDELIHDGVNIADFAPIENARVAFGARTGGANANQFIDNFRIVLDAGGSASGPIPGLIAHFPLDSDGDSSDGNFTASTVTDVEFGADGATSNTGTSATFNGASSLIQHDWNAKLNPEESFTLSLWAKSDGGAGAWHSPVTSRNDLNPDSQGYIIYDNQPAGNWTFWSGNGTAEGNWQLMDGPEATLGEWEHLTIVYDSAEEMKRLYVNGELAVEANDSVFPNDTKPFNIGAGGDIGTAYFFKGDIDDIGIWDRALSQSEIQTVMEQGVSGGGGAAGPAVAYEAPEGGWSYSLDTGDISSWNHDNGSDQWDESAIGGEFGDDNRPGGVSLIDGYVRIQDTGDPRDNYPDPGSNRKIYLGQDISDKGGSDTILDDGATIHFIARIPTDGPLDPLGDEDYPAGGDGYENHDGGKGNIGIKQGAGGIVSFSLNEEGKVLITEDGTEMELSTTEWHEFWVTIEAGDGGHKVSVYLDGSTEATEFTVTAGGGSDFGGSYVAMGVGSTGRSGALDVAAFDFSPGVIAPAGAGGGDLVDVSVPGDEVVASSDNSPGAEQAPNAIDDNDQTKYLNFDGANNEPSGLTITTSGGVVTGLGLTSANDAPDRDPATFVLSGSNDGGETFTEIASGDVPAFGARFERQEVSFANEDAYTTYELIFPTTTGPSTCCMQIAEIELLGKLADVPEPLLPPELPWSVGRNDDGWPAGNGGGPSTSFVQEAGSNELPGDPASPEVAQQADDDYYWAGEYSTVIAGNGDYEPVGLVEVNEEAAERAFAGIDNDLRYHFNLPSSLQPTDQLIVSYDALNLHTDGQTDPRYGVEVYVNNVQVQSEVVIRPEQLGQTYDTEPFSVADVNAEVGLGYDNIITLKGVNYNAEGGGNWMGIDYVQLSQVAGALKEPTIVDFGDLSGDASYEFHFNAVKAGASTAIAGNNAFAIKLDQWNEQGVFGTTVFGVADNVFTPLDGKSVASVFDRDVHVVVVNDTAAGETRLYVDGDHVGVLDGNFELAGEAKVMGARIEQNTDPMGEGSVMHKWAVYNSALSAAEIADLAAAVGGGGGDAPALSIVNNGDGTVTVTFEGRLEAATSVNGPWQDSGLTSPATIPADQAQQYGRAVRD